MINLLPPDTQEDYRYARRNRKITPWIIVTTLSLAGLAVIGFYGTISQDNVAKSYEKQLSTTKTSLKKERVGEVKAKVNDISSSLKLAISVLEEEVLFSKLLRQITTVIPSGVNLTGLNINQADGAIDISAKASNYNAATQLQANLTDPGNKIFSKADLVSVNCAQQGKEDPAHPCSVDIRALFGDNKQFLFINDGKEEAKS